MFKRTHHQAIEQVLRLMNADLLKAHQCYFGGGTAIALRHGEYRELVDIDLMVSDLASYRALRTLVRESGSVLGLFNENTTLISQRREVRADQYGIRTAIGLGQHNIKSCHCNTFASRCIAETQRHLISSLNSSYLASRFTLHSPSRYSSFQGASATGEKPSSHFTSFLYS